MGAGFEIKWNKRALERAVKEAASKGVREIAERMQRVVDAVSLSQAGKTAAEIAPALKREMARIDVTITDPELTQYAQAISEGRRIMMQPDQPT